MKMLQISEKENFSMQVAILYYLRTVPISKEEEQYYNRILQRLRPDEKIEPLEYEWVCLDCGHEFITEEAAKNCCPTQDYKRIDR